MVQWDQRGSGKSYVANDPVVIGPTLSLDRIVDDAMEVVQYLRTRYGKEKVFVIGHSWGSVVGLTLAHRHPDLLYAYIGMGQVIGGIENERVGYQLTLKSAESRKDATATHELKSIAPYPEKDGAVPLAKINVERKWSVAFGGLTYGRTTSRSIRIWRSFPDYLLTDTQRSTRALTLAALARHDKFDYTQVTDFQCPIFIRRPVRSHHTISSRRRMVWPCSRAEEGPDLVREFVAHDRGGGTRPRSGPPGRGSEALG